MLRNLHIPAIILTPLITVLVLAVMPFDVMLKGTNVLSILAEMVTAGISTRFTGANGVVFIVRRAVVEGMGRCGCYRSPLRWCAYGYVSRSNP